MPHQASKNWHLSHIYFDTIYIYIYFKLLHTFGVHTKDINDSS